MNDVFGRAVALMVSTRVKLFLTSVGMLLMLIWGFTGIANAATFTVNNAMDTIDDNISDGNCHDAVGKCSLRAAIMQSNATPGPDIINIPQGTYTLMLAGRGEDNAATGDLDITDDVTIVGTAGDPALTVIQAGNTPTGIDRVFEVNPNLAPSIAFTLKSVTIQHGSSRYESKYVGSFGGGIVADIGQGSLLISNCIISDNTAEDNGNGGGLSLSGLPIGTIRIEKSIIRNNTAKGGSGGVEFIADSLVEVADTTFSGNIAGQYEGGGIYYRAPGYGYGVPKSILIENSTISGNQANGLTRGKGGGLYINGQASLSNLTVSGNQSQSGGGLYLYPNGKTITVTNSTVTLNQPNGLQDAVYVNGAGADIHNTIIAGNVGSVNIAGTNVSASSSHNLIGPGGSGGLTDGTNGNLVGILDPKLGPLADNGGLTQTHALLNGSPAIDAGDDSKAAELTVDQRGTPRSVDSADADSVPTTDIGAYEAHATISDIANATTSVNAPKTINFNVSGSPLVGTVTAASSNQALLPNGNITIGGTGQNRTITLTPAAGQIGKATITVSVSETGGGPNAVDTFDVDVISSPDLTITKSHTGDFFQGQTGATYTIQVKNAGPDPTSGTVTVTDQLPTGLTAKAISGTGWTCTLGTLGCTRSDALAAGASYPDITLVVDVAANAPTSLTNTASVTGGNDVNSVNNQASDLTNVLDKPKVVSVDAPPNGIYNAGQTLDFTIQYSRNVVVNTTGGKPFIPVTIGGAAVNASYEGGSGTQTISFRYTVQTGDYDADGITIGNAVSVNGSTIKDSVTGNDADLALNSVPAMTGVKVDAVAPKVVSVAVPSDKAYGVGQSLDFTVKFDEPVTVTGTPALDVTIGSQTVKASYESGAGTSDIRFRYTVQAGKTDDDGIAISGPIALNGGAIKDTAGNNAVLELNNVGVTANVRVDTTAPSVLAVSIPTARTYHTGEDLDFTVKFDEAVTVSGGKPSISVTIGGAAKHAEYVSGAGTTALVFRYSVQAGDEDADGITLGSTIANNGASLTDLAGNAAGLALQGVPGTTNILVDTTAPVVNAVAVPANGTYRAGQDMLFKLTFSENVFVDTTGGTPSLPLTIGADTVQAVYEGGSGTNILEFRYTVQAGKTDANGITVGGAVAANGGTIRDNAGNGAVPTVNGVESTAGVLVDAVIPAVTSVQAPADKAYIAGEDLEFKVTMSKPTEVDTTNGTPSIEIVIGTKAKQAALVSGAGTTVLTFRYTVEAGDYDGDGIAVAGSISLNNGFMRDSSGNNADLALNGTSSTSGVKVDAVAPKSISVAVPSSGTYHAGESLDFNVTFDEAVIVAGGKPSLTLEIGSKSVEAPFVSGSGTNSLTYSYTVTDGDNDSDGIKVVSVIQLNGAAIRDAASNNADLSLTGIADTSHVLIDTAAPDVKSVTLPADAFYRKGDALEFTVVFNEAVTVTGTPAIPLMIGGASQQAAYDSGSGTDTLLFRYTVQLTDEDDDGIEVGNSITLTGSSIQDAGGNAAIVVLHPGSTAGIRVDNAPPAAPTLDMADGTRFNNSEIQLTGAGEADATIEIFVDSAAKETGRVGADGKWSVQVTGLTEGSHQIKAVSKDAAGNQSESALLNFSVRLTAPPKPSVVVSEPNWTNQDVTVTIRGDTGNKVQYNINGGSWEDYSGTITLTTEGESVLSARQTDDYGNVSGVETATIRIDKTSPVITLKGSATMNVYKGSTFQDPGVTITDNLAAGLVPVVTQNVDTKTLGTYTVTYNAEDFAGNKAVEVTRIVKVITRPVPPPDSHPVTEVRLDKKQLTLTVDGNPVTLHATILPENATNKAVVWSSSNPEVAQVDGNGTITARKAGHATITVTTMDGYKTADCEVTVVEKTSLHLEASATTFRLEPHESVRFKVNAVDGEKQTDITTDPETSYRIDNDLVTVDQGRITAGDEEGESVITVSYRGEELTLRAVIEQDKDTFHLESSDWPFWIRPNGTARFKVYAVDGEKRKDITNDKNTTYSIDNDLIAVKKGRIEAGSEEGESLITVSYQGESLTMPVTISKVTIRSLTASAKQLVLESDEERQVKVTATYSDKSSKEITDQAGWVSSNSSVAEVTEDGRVVANKSGTAVIKANYGGKRADIKILVVKEKNPQRLRANYASVRLKSDQTVSISVIAQYEKGFQEEVTAEAEWTSEDPQVATVEKGVLTAIAEGRTKVTVSYKGKKVTITVSVSK